MEKSSQISASTDIERSGLRSWNFGDLPTDIETQGPGHTIRAYPALVDEQDTVAIRLFADREGHIGLQSCGRIPKRGGGQIGLAPIPAWDESLHWQGNPEHTVTVVRNIVGVTG